MNMMIKDILLVGAGSCVGGVARYLVSLLLRSSVGGFPWATFIVNIVGCLLIGALWGITSRCSQTSTWVNLCFMIGFCGSFTTFSTFSKESITLLQTGCYTVFVTYVLGSVLLGLLAVMVGLVLFK